MKVLFAVSNEEISESIVKRYQKDYKEIISYKNVYYFNAILKELQKDKSYDRIVISEELEAFTNTQDTQIDKFLFDKLDSISDEAANLKGDDIPIILITLDRRIKSEEMLVKIFGIGIYNALLGNDRSVDKVCNLLNKPRTKKEAKIYYKIDSDDVSYQSENENDVSEVEIQNILAHYKRLGKDERKYVDSFDNIASQYNDIQLRIISKFLPLNVRAVLEEQSPKYQQIISFNSKVSDNLRAVSTVQKATEGTSEKLLKSNNGEGVLSKPVIIPSSVNMNSTKKLGKVKNEVRPFEVSNTESKINELNLNNEKIRQNEINYKEEKVRTDIRKIGPAFEEKIQRKEENKDDLENILNQIETPITQPILEPEIEEIEVEEKKRKRGRPRKNPVPIQNETTTPKRGRGRPRKNIVAEEQERFDLSKTNTEDNMLPGFEDIDAQDNVLPGLEDIDIEDKILPGFEDIDTDDNMLPGFEDIDTEDNMLPGLEDINTEDNMLPGLEDINTEDNMLPGLEDIDTNDSILPGFEDIDTEDTILSNSKDEKEQVVSSPRFEGAKEETNIRNAVMSEIETQKINHIQRTDMNYSDVDISNLLTPDRKIASFIGTSKNGTSFIINNLAEITSQMGINTAILDTTKNRNSYYIYNRNEEELRKIAMESISNLLQGNAKGIQVNKNLTVYTSLPDETEGIENAGKILQTLLMKHSLILIDCDFDTPMSYFEKTQEIYLVQSFDILTMQPLTAFLRELKTKNILRENKLRIVLNKAIELRKVKEKTIIDGMSMYNDPAMSFMTELFNKDTIKHITIPFNQEVYTRYLEGVINCEISIKGYPKNIMQALNELSSMVYPIVSGRGTYTPPKIEKNGFTPSINATLNQMKNKY